MIDFSDFYQTIAKSNLQHWLESVPAKLAQWQRAEVDGRLKQWLKQVELLPTLSPALRDLKQSVTVTAASPLSTGEQKQLTHLLKQLAPWRKGPFSLYGIEIDAEWRSDWKWQRLLPHISPLAGKTVLDIGCNSGYHLWRMLGEGAKLAIGIDPMALYLCQFLAVQKLIGPDLPAYFLPLGIEALPASNAFDTVFSMGVLYHRRSPLDHLWQIKDQLTAGGELVLETLVVDGDAEHVLLPGDRYAQMRNVYFIPSVKAMCCWLEKCGFTAIKVADISITTTDEQRKTDWMTSDSLADFLDPQDSSKTIEGYPAPKRAIFIAKKP